MERRIKIVFKNPHERLMKCVYRISIGDMLYIGRTRQLDQRIKAHENYINKAIENYSQLVLYKRVSERDLLRPCRFYIQFAKYLLEHPKIEVLEVEAIYHSPYHKDISGYENSRLRLWEKHPDCLNNIFVSGIDRKHYHEYTCKKVGNFLYYYEIDNPNELIPHYYNLYNTGKYNIPQSIIKERKLRRAGM